MNSKKNTAFLPLWSWGVVAAIIVLILVSAYSIAAIIEDKKYSNVDHLNLTRLAHLDDSRPIIAIGTSLTYRGFYYDDEMQQKLREYGVKNRFVRISASSAKKSSFEGALPLIVESLPSVVLIELEMLLVDHSVKQDAKRYTLMQNIRIIYGWLKYTLFGIAFADAKDVFPSNYGLDQNCTNKYSSGTPVPETSELSQQQLTVYEEFLSQPWLDFIEDVHRNGGKVIILEVGRSSYASQGLTSKFMNDYENNIQKIKELPSLSYWRFPGPFTLDNYCDLAHLNDQGSANFVNWIMPQLRSTLNE